MMQQVTWIVVLTVAATLASCTGNPSGGSNSTETGAFGITADLLPATGTPEKLSPAFGGVDGMAPGQLKPGVSATAKVSADGLELTLGNDAVITSLLDSGERVLVAEISSGETTLIDDGKGGRAKYYEAQRPDGTGNKVAMGISGFPPGLIDDPIVFIRMNSDTNSGRSPMMTFRNLGFYTYADQAIMRLDPDGTLTQVLAITGRPMQDLEASYDGRKILFTMREFGGDDMEIFEVNIDGTNLRQMTFNEYNDAEPMYLPDGRIMFTSERMGIGDFYDAGTQVPQMFVLDPFTGVERLVHISSDGCYNPIVRHNGEVLFVSWDTRLNYAGPRFNRFTIWKMNPDGTDAFPVFGTHVARDSIDCFIDVRETHDHQLAMVHTNFNIPGIGRAHHENFGSGSVMFNDPESSADFPSMTYITPREIVDSGADNTLGRYKFPVPLPDGNMLVTYSPGDVWDLDDGEAPDFGIYHLTRDGVITALCDAEGLWEFGAVSLAPRDTPPVIPDITVPAEAAGITWGELACDSIFNRSGDMRQAHPKPEDGPWMLRVIQARKVRGVNTGDPGNLAFDNRNFPVMANGNVIGEYLIAEDGSFRIRIPANTPIAWELVDGTGRVAARERIFNITRPGETRKCAGCHGRVDHSEPVDLSRPAFQPDGEGFHDLRGLFEDFENDIIDNDSGEV